MRMMTMLNKISDILDLILQLICEKFVIFFNSVGAAQFYTGMLYSYIYSPKIYRMFELLFLPIWLFCCCFNKNHNVPAVLTHLINLVVLTKIKMFLLFLPNWLISCCCYNKNYSVPFACFYYQVSWCSHY